MNPRVNLHLGAASQKRWELCGINLSAKLLLAVSAHMDSKNEVPASRALIASWVGIKDPRIIYRPMQILLKEGAIVPVPHPMGKRAITYMLDPRIASVSFNPPQLISLIKRFLALKGEEVSSHESSSLDRLFSIPDYEGMGGEVVEDTPEQETDYVSQETV